VRSSTAGGAECAAQSLALRPHSLNAL
jgi:hypothetical protein